jgi:putative FmdB family regulatory protein
MPAYDYRCPFCGDTKVIKLPISEADQEQECSCGTVMVKKFSVPAVVFKGSGFYSTSTRKVTS